MAVIRRIGNSYSPHLGIKQSELITLAQLEQKVCICLLISGWIIYIAAKNTVLWANFKNSTNSFTFFAGFIWLIPYYRGLKVFVASS